MDSVCFLSEIGILIQICYCVFWLVTQQRIFRSISAPQALSIHPSIHPYIHTYIHTNIHTCMHTYIQTYRTYRKGPLRKRKSKPAAATTWTTLFDWQQGFFCMHNPTFRKVHTTAFFYTRGTGWNKKQIIGSILKDRSDDPMTGVCYNSLL